MTRQKHPAKAGCRVPLLDGMTARRRLPPRSGRDHAASPPSPPAPKKGATQGGPPKHRLNMRSPAMRAIRPLSIKRIARHTVSTGQIPLIGQPGPAPSNPRDRLRHRRPATRAGDVPRGGRFGRAPSAISRRSWGRAVVRQANLTAQNATPTALPSGSLSFTRPQKNGPPKWPNNVSACLPVRQREAASSVDPAPTPRCQQLQSDRPATVSIADRQKKIPDGDRD